MLTTEIREEVYDELSKDDGVRVFNCGPKFLAYCRAKHIDVVELFEAAGVLSDEEE